jgi:hypothetical protein
MSTTDVHTASARMPDGMKILKLLLNEVRTEFIWVGTRQNGRVLVNTVKRKFRFYKMLGIYQLGKLASQIV